MTQKPIRKVRVTPRARDDLKNIGRYTERIWGKTQRNSYLSRIDARLHWLAENPQLGKHRTDLCEGYYRFPEGQHVIFYLIGSSAIDIIGVLHKEMDVISYFMEG
ncbi:type II toxin-antitoxin system RelE/ParE family toxin [Litoribacillus peritrichatus]|uniref:Toxin n=1 Tax=Litoribacillus peritrichatus TaxID=718191 RepID=A0ABP7MQC9_9GAMM